MESRFHADFGAVRVHTGDKAERLNRQFNAHAFTLGNQIFFGKGKFDPDSPQGRELIAHELTHTIQQGGAVQRGPDRSVTQLGQPKVQRLGLSDALDYFADKANNIPGFRMFTILLGVNPINMSRVERSAANILRAIVEFLPGGHLITEALDNYGVFDKVGTWIEQQLSSLGITGAAIKAAIMEFLDSLSWTDIFHLGDVWDRAKRIFTDPIGRLIDFAKSLITEILRFIRKAILRPLAKLAEGTRGYDLLKAILGEDPVTSESVPHNADTLIGGFMKLIGQEEIWENLKKSRAVPRAWAWFQGAMGALMGFVSQIPGLFVKALQSLELSDIVLLPRAFMKVAGVFATFIGDFIRWAGEAVWNLLEIIFSVLAPAVIPYLKKAAGAFRTILRNPIGFVGNLVRAGLLGLRQFAKNFLTHLRASLVGWLTGALSGMNVYIPQSFTLPEVVKFVLSVLGLTWQNIRQKLVKVIGEAAVKAMEIGFDIVVTLVTEGPAAAWEKIKETLSNLKEMVIDGAMNFVKERVVQAAIEKLATSLNPAGAFIQAIIAIYNTVMFFIERLRQIAQVAAAFIDSISAIASGAIAAAANRVETTMAGLLTLIISFLARIAGLGKVSDAVTEVIDRVRQPIDRALDRVVEWIRDRAQSFLQRAAGGTPEERLARGLTAGQQVVNRFAGRAIGVAVLRPLLAAIRTRFQLSSLEPVEDGAYWAVEGVVNPRRRSPRTQAEIEGAQRERGIDPEPVSEVDFGTNRVRVQFSVLSRRFEMFHSLQRHHYNFLSGAGSPESQNSLMHHNLSIDAARQDGLALGRNLQGRLRTDVRQQLKVEGTYGVAGRSYIVDSSIHFFVASGSQVWGGVSREAWVAARNLRLIEQTAISPDRIRRMVTSGTAKRLIETGGRRREDFERRTPQVNSAAKEIRDANAYLGLGIVSGRNDLVLAFRDLDRLDQG